MMLSAWLASWALVSGALAPDGAAPARRYVLIASQNLGNANEPPLSYADEDGQRLKAALLETGAVSGDELTVLQDATADSLRAALRALEQKLSKRDQLLIYVSSHADDAALHLKSSLFPLVELRDFLNRAPVAVAILVLDSCQSGTLTRAKGLQRGGSAVRFEAPQVSGRVIISSSAEDEYSQESERLRGSFFTHHFAAALRGAADESEDGQVTLQEAYAYTYARTVESTFATRGGAQHPGFSVSLKGRGELVLSTPTRSRGRLVLDTNAASEWLVTAANGSIVADVLKPAARVVLAVAPGDYRVQAREPSGLRHTVVKVQDDAQVVVDSAQLPLTPLEVKVAARGGEAGWTLSAQGSIGRGALEGLGPLWGGDLRLHGPLVSMGPVMLEWSASLSAHSGRATVAPAFTQSELGLQVGVGPALYRGRFRLWLSLGGGALGISQTDTPDVPVRLGIVPLAEGRLGVDVRLSDHFGLSASGWGGPALMPLEGQGSQLRARAGGGLGVFWRP